MGKLEELRRMAGENVEESMGMGRPARPPETAAGLSAPARWQGVSKSKNAAEIPTDKIGPDPDQPREDFDEASLARLAESLKSRGQLQPIRVRWDECRGSYVIVCGERRWRAAVKAGLPTLSCVVMEGPVSAADLLVLQLIENCVREDLKPIEQARAFKALMETHGWTVRRLAEEISLNHSSIVRALSLLDLPSSIQDQVEQGTLPPATAYEISKVEDPTEQAELAARVVDEGMSRAETVAAVRQATGKPARSKGRGAGKARRITSRVFRTAMGKATVELRKGSGNEVIRDVLEEALRAIKAELGEATQEAA
jgi:ParB family chromosome partitioning protein